MPSVLNAVILCGLQPASKLPVAFRVDVVQFGGAEQGLDSDESFFRHGWSLLEVFWTSQVLYTVRGGKANADQKDKQRNQQGSEVKLFAVAEECVSSADFSLR